MYHMNQVSQYNNAAVYMLCVTYSLEGNPIDVSQYAALVKLSGGKLDPWGWVHSVAGTPDMVGYWHTVHIVI